MTGKTYAHGPHYRDVLHEIMSLSFAVLAAPSAWGAGLAVRLGTRTTPIVPRSGCTPGARPWSCVQEDPNKFVMHLWQIFGKFKLQISLSLTSVILARQIWILNRTARLGHLVGTLCFWCESLQVTFHLLNAFAFVCYVCCSLSVKSTEIFSAIKRRACFAISTLWTWATGGTSHRTPEASGTAWGGAGHRHLLTSLHTYFKQRLNFSYFTSILFQYMFKSCFQTAEGHFRCTRAIYVQRMQIWWTKHSLSLPRKSRLLAHQLQGFASEWHSEHSLPTLAIHAFGCVRWCA